jgi:pilus assembly protein CpaB
MVLGVALLAAVAALFLVRGMAAKAPPPQAQTLVTNGVPVLVAMRAMDQGESAAPGDLAWANFPTESISENFIQQKNNPRAINDYVGAVARFHMEKGEPVTAAKLVKPGEQGFMAAMLTPGYRAVSLPISQNSAVAGFILPNDRVDIISTRKVQLTGPGGGEEARANIILENVRVLAIDQKYKPPAPNEPAAMPGAVATVELAPADAEILAMADKVGEVSLALRGLRNEPGGAIASARHHDDGNVGSVRMHRFGTIADASVKSSGSRGDNR